MDRQDNTKEIKYDWKRVERDVSRLAEKIKSSFLPDTIVVIAEGGWVPGSLLKRKIGGTYLSFGCDSYDKNDKKLDVVKVYQSVPGNLIRNKKVLVFDEICDSGDTLFLVKSLIENMDPLELKTAVLHLKKNSKFGPDYYEKIINDEWLIYPWTK